MTVTTTAASVTYTGNGSATNWPFNFKVLAEDDLVVKLLDTSTAVLTTLSSSAYTINGIGDDAGGSVDYPLSGSPISSTKRIIIDRILDYTQELDIINQAGFFPDTLEQQLDKIVMQVQQIAELEERSLRLPAGDAVSDGELAIDATRAGKLLGFDANGNFTYTAGEVSDLTTYETRAALTGANVDAAVNVVRTGGYANTSDGGGALYKRVGAEPSHNLKVQSADGAWWELVPDPMGISVYQAGAAGDGVTDDSQAFLDAINGVEDVNAGATDTATHPVIVPPGDYYMGSTTLELKRVVHIRGFGSGMGNRPKPAKLQWDANVTGIIVHTSDTTGATTEGTGTGGGNGSIIEGLELTCATGTIAGVTDITKGHGIVLRARATIRQCWVHEFPGNGIHIRADLGAGGEQEGNANQWLLEAVRSTSNHQNGVYVDDDDANAGYGYLIDVTGNGRWGINDSSFLGNTWVACHSSDNGNPNNGENGAAENHRVFYDDGGGNEKYLAHRDATQAQLVATTPGSDETVWITIEAGTWGTEWTAAQPEGTFFPGGDYASDNPNARTVFFNCYVEGNNGYPQLKAPAMFINGKGMLNTIGPGIFSGSSKPLQFRQNAEFEDNVTIKGTKFDVEGECEVDGDFDHNGTAAAFFGQGLTGQHTTEGTTTGFTAGSGTAVNDDSTFTGNSGTKAYTVGDIVKALKDIGIMAES